MKERGRNHNVLARENEMLHGPEDHWAYSRIELDAIWNTPVHTEDITQDRVRRHAFFEFVDETSFAAIVAKATVAEVIDNDPEPTDEICVCIAVDGKWTHIDSACKKDEGDVQC